jgi:hypothetical protein
MADKACHDIVGVGHYQMNRQVGMLSETKADHAAKLPS